MLRRHAGGAEALTILAPVSTVGELLVALTRKAPALAAHLDDGVFTFAVNDEVLRDGMLQHPVKDGDRIEIRTVPSPNCPPSPKATVGPP